MIRNTFLLSRRSRCGNDGVGKPEVGAIELPQTPRDRRRSPYRSPR
ncbi:MAG: hypothetical protein ABFD75_09915 [Smithella sp.]